MTNTVTIDPADLTFPTPTPEQLAEADRLDAKAAAARQEAADSFERCDTDGFISQWASGLTARECSLQATILRQGGVGAFYGLFKDGRRVKARLVETEWGTSWVVLDSNDKARLWLPHTLTCVDQERNLWQFGPRTKAAKLGYQVGMELAPAKATLVGRGTGLAGAASVTVGVRRTDGGYPADAVPFEAL